MNLSAKRIDIGVIGGSGLYDLDQLRETEEIRCPTPYGDPSDVLMTGTLAGRRVAFLPRHGRGHRIPPSAIPVQANIYALKSLGVREVVSVSAVGSLREDFAPGDLVVPDQIVDRTHGFRAASFFGEGLVVHAPFADPYCRRLRAELTRTARQASDVTVHDGGTYCCMEGPQFSTRAESNLHRSWGMDLIGMTAVPEAKLAREAELCYVGLALVTDYDCWRSDAAESVDASTVVDAMARSAGAAQRTLVAFIGALADDPDCACRQILSHSIITDRAAIPSAVRDRYELLVDKHLGVRPRATEAVRQL